MELLQALFPYVTSAGVALAWILSYKTRISEKRKIDTEAEAQWAEIYRGIIAELRVEVGQLKQEVIMMKAIVESYKESCDGCPNNKKKKNEPS